MTTLTLSFNVNNNNNHYVFTKTEELNKTGHCGFPTLTSNGVKITNILVHLYVTSDCVRKEVFHSKIVTNLKCFWVFPKDSQIKDQGATAIIFYIFSLHVDPCKEM